MIISKPKKPNHPTLGSRIKIEPIRDKSAIRLIEENLSGHPRNLAIFTMGIYTGIRPSDMLLLTVDQARKAADSGELIFCEIKTEKLMQMHLAEKVRVAVTSWLQKRWKNRDPAPQTHLFVGSKGPLKTPTINKLVKKWCRDVGIEGNFGTLTLRKTYGYHMLLDGQKSLKEFKHFFNHSRGRETLNYLCIPPEEQARVRLNRESRHPTDPTRGLLKRIADLETEIKGLKQIARENSLDHVFHKTIFENASDQIAFVDINGIFLDVNEQAVDVFGFSRDEIVGQSIFDIEYMDPEGMKKLFIDFYRIAHSPEKRVAEYTGIRKDKSTIYYEVASRPVYKNDSLIGFVAIIRDITKRKEAEFELLKHRDQLEQKVTERTRRLDEINTAMEVLLQKRTQDKNEMEQKIVYNVKELILPGLEKLKRAERDENRIAGFELIESNLNNIISPFAQNLSSKKFGLTPTELKVANHIKHGLSTKKIAEYLNLSNHTIQFHRANIRKKLGISRDKTNLRAYLQIDTD